MIAYIAATTAFVVAAIVCIEDATVHTIALTVHTHPFEPEVNVPEKVKAFLL